MNPELFETCLERSLLNQTRQVMIYRTPDEEKYHSMINKLRLVLGEDTDGEDLEDIENWTLGELLALEKTAILSAAKILASGAEEQKGPVLWMLRGIEKVEDIIRERSIENEDTCWGHSGILHYETRSQAIRRLS